MVTTAELEVERLERGSRDEFWGLGSEDRNAGNLGFFCGGWEASFDARFAIFYEPCVFDMARVAWEGKAHLLCDPLALYGPTTNRTCGTCW